MLAQSVDNYGDAVLVLSLLWSIFVFVFMVAVFPFRLDGKREAIAHLQALEAQTSSAGQGPVFGVTEGI